MSDQRRGSSTERGYGTEHRDRFRASVLQRQLICAMCQAEPSTVADHFPLSRRELEQRGMDPNDPQYGRGLCASCHGKATAATPAQRGGWNRH